MTAFCFYLFSALTLIVCMVDVIESIHLFEFEFDSHPRSSVQHSSSALQQHSRKKRRSLGHPKFIPSLSSSLPLSSPRLELNSMGFPFGHTDGAYIASWVAAFW